MDRGHIEKIPKLWNFSPYNRRNGEITRILRRTASYHKLREETKGWGDYKKLPEEITDFPLIRRMLLGADSVVQTPRLRKESGKILRDDGILFSIALRFVAKRSALGSGVTAPYGKIDDLGRVEISQETMKKTGADSVTLPAKTSGAQDITCDTG